MSVEDFSKYVVREDVLKALSKLTDRNDVEFDDGVEIQRATKGVEGYMSVVLRVQVSYRFRGTKKKHPVVFIVKSMPREGIQAQIAQSTKIFFRESLYFDKAVPLMKKASGGKVDLPLPVSYLALSGGNCDAIYMEDLSMSGYTTPDRSYWSKGLDFAHCSVALKGYGKLHALTVAAEKLLPRKKKTWMEAFPELGNDLIFHSTGSDEDAALPFKKMMEEGLETILEICKVLEGLPKEAEESGKLRSVMEGTWDLMSNRVKPSLKGPNVLSHGDCWMNNLMFKYESVGEENKKPIDVKFIDFQVARYCHPCVDILNFIFSGTRESFRSSHLNMLIHTYYESFAKTLKVLNYGAPPFTLDELRGDIFRAYKAFGHYCEIIFRPMLLLGEEFAPSNAEEMTSEKYEDLLSNAYSFSVRQRFDCDPHYRSLIEEFVRSFVDAVFPNGLDYPESPMFKN